MVRGIMWSTWVTWHAHECISEKAIRFPWHMTFELVTMGVQYTLATDCRCGGILTRISAFCRDFGSQSRLLVSKKPEVFPRMISRVTFLNVWCWHCDRLSFFNAWVTLINLRQHSPPHNVSIVSASVTAGIIHPYTSNRYHLKYWGMYLAVHSLNFVREHYYVSPSVDKSTGGTSVSHIISF